MQFWLTLLQNLPVTDSSAEPIDQPANLSQQPTLLSSAAVDYLPPAMPLAVAGEGVVLAGGIGGILLLLLIGTWAYTRVYTITPTNEAFVLTGGVFRKGKKVVLNGGCVVLPGFHELTRVPLREISVDVERTGKLAVRTKDYLRADMRATFFVYINASEGDVLTAAARLSQSNRITPENIKNAIEKKADDAIRAAAKKKSLSEIDSDKLGFAQEVLDLIQPDLEKLGLTLNNISISEIEESDTYEENNFFDAQGVRLRTETIQRSIQQKREVELQVQIGIEQRELDAHKQSLKIKEQQESARLEQQLQVESLKAQREREIQESRARELAVSRRTQILQDQGVEEEEIRKKLAVQQSQVEADISLEERNKQLKVTQVVQRQEAEAAEIARQQAIESAQFQARARVAEAERQTRLVQEEAAIDVATRQRERLLTEANRAQAEASVVTATAIEQADREKRLALIDAEKQAEQKRLSEQNVVEIDAFRRRRAAEVAQAAAELEAESLRVLAQATREKLLAEAEGTRAKILAENTISNPRLLENLLNALGPDLVTQLPEMLRALAPQPGVLGDARVYAFPGAGGNGSSNGNGANPDINRLLLSTSGLSLINTLLEEGKLATLLGQLLNVVRNPAPIVNPTVPELERLEFDGKGDGNGSLE
ncbi:flotillin family protein [Leptolyngbya sp. FACHB-261]|uniref:flotillin family protein n=1 Tax=Leptolyngbya sp. FACHB-261 TaxID=2692806 RepID=UPI0016842C67|nr:SPFH domain-containing protein [Leptolyngbya sp. FACHB-261]MBD2100721.1 flotillin family protein [Leptolyngbya sp. FACHB-261]